jgi:hypothetical protein
MTEPTTDHDARRATIMRAVAEYTRRNGHTPPIDWAAHQRWYRRRRQKPQTVRETLPLFDATERGTR